MDAKKLRESKDLDQTAFWGRVSVRQSAGSRYETGRRIPKPIQILLSIAYGNLREARRTVDALRK